MRRITFPREIVTKEIMACTKRINCYIYVKKV